jgi:Flp pilus assembly protein TadD
MKQGKMQAAIDDFNQAAKIKPDLVWAYLNRGVAKVYLGDEAGAQTDFDTCLKLNANLKAQIDNKVDLARKLRQISQ